MPKSIELSDEQYRTLIELVYLGSWIANATKLSEEEMNQDYIKLEQLLYKQSKMFKSEDIIALDKRTNSYYTTSFFEDGMMPVVEQYDDDSFWEELSSRLAKRDLLKETGPVHKWSEKQLSRKYELEEYYEQEFTENGLRNLVLKKERGAIS
ncbi:hypothetical protein ACFPVX_03740 [Cohnella faecalis]|uniref:Uncharacterized protein n=1 Tax=Cohnella faecalis TaxID=2315694 RepID=A0A398CM86_9BACL|nr:hypothetical protein [Cohnella faecalis]RIE03372.1 hypothetical protein D3H35_11885 [Cohnella faecalis]